MVCASLKVEFAIESLDQHQEAASALCVGGTVGLAFRDNRLHCLSGEQLLGFAPRGTVRELPPGAGQGVVRSVRREPGTGKVLQLLVRVTGQPAGEPTRPGRLPLPAFSLDGAEPSCACCRAARCEA